MGDPSFQLQELVVKNEELKKKKVLEVKVTLEITYSSLLLLSVGKLRPREEAPRVTEAKVEPGPCAQPPVRAPLGLGS